MIISATFIKKPGTYRMCGECRSELVGHTIDLYGAAFSGDKPWHLYLHPRCVSNGENNEKINKALQTVEGE